MTEEAPGKKKLTFQQQHKRILYLGTAMGFFPPGAEELYSSALVRKILRVFCTIICTSPILLTTSIVTCTILNPPSLIVTIFIIRKAVAFFPYFIKLPAHAYNLKRFRQLNNLFRVWNYEINTGEKVDRREELLRKEMKTIVFLFKLSVIGGAVLMGAVQIPFFFNRHMRGSALAYVYHDPNAWYHFHLVGLQLYFYTIPCVTGFSFGFLCLSLMAMAATQYQILREDLAEIFSTITISKDGLMVKNTKNGEIPVTDEILKEETAQVRKKLKLWVDAHHQTQEWVDEMMGFFWMTATTKIIYLGGYLTLLVFTLPYYLKNGNWVDVFLMTSYILGNFGMSFWESRLGDYIRENSQQLFFDAYSKLWTIYPRDVTQALNIISMRCIYGPTRVLAFSNYEDNSENFLNLMQTAYQALSFLLQMDIF